MAMNIQAIKTIEALGGTAAVARLFGVRMPSVSDWKKAGIPKARMMYLRAAHAQALMDIDVDAATAQTQGNAQEPSPSPPAAQNMGAIDLDKAGLVDRCEGGRRSGDIAQHVAQEAV